VEKKKRTLGRPGLSGGQGMSGERRDRGMGKLLAFSDKCERGGVRDDVRGVVGGEM